MRASLKAVLGLFTLSALTMVGVGGIESARATQPSDCGSTTTSDSAYLIDFVSRVATDTGYSAARLYSNIPLSDSAKFWPSASDCDSVSTRYRAYLVAQTGDSLWPPTPVLLVRVFPNRFVADPKMTDGNGAQVLVTLDENLNILKVWNVR